MMILGNLLFILKKSTENVKKQQSAPLRSRNDEEKALRREALLNAAQEVFFEKGFDKTSMDDIAGKAGFSRSLLYVYFSNKLDIYRALRIRSVEILRDRMKTYVDLSASGRERVGQVGSAFFDFYTHDRSHFDCLNFNISLNSQERKLKSEFQDDQETLEAERETMQIMVDSLLAGIDDGSINKKKVTNPLQTAMYLRGCLHGVILLQDDNGSALLSKAGIDKTELIDYAMTNIIAPLCE